MPSDSSNDEPLAVSREGVFATTHWSVVLTAGRNDSPNAQAALERLCRAYWYPIYLYIRRRGQSPHDAEDFTQDFFARLLEKNYLGAAEPAKGRFRSFLLSAVSHFLSNRWEHANATKRGGGIALISLDGETAENRYSLEPVTHATAEDAFEKRWAITLMERAFAQVQQEYLQAGKEQLFERLKEFLADGTGHRDYAMLAAELGRSANAVAVAVHRLRQRYREVVRAEVADTLASTDDIADEMRHLVATLGR